MSDMEWFPVFSGSLRLSDLELNPHYPNDCRVYWGSHGCDKERGHKGPHACRCGTPPYRGRWTRFYGEDVTPFNRVWWHVAGWYYRLRYERRRSVRS